MDVRCYHLTFGRRFGKLKGETIRRPNSIRAVAAVADERSFRCQSCPALRSITTDSARNRTPNVLVAYEPAGDRDRRRFRRRRDSRAPSYPFSHGMGHASEPERDA